MIATRTTPMTLQADLDRRRAIQALNAGDFTAALRLAKKLLREKKKDAELMGVAGIAASKLGHLDDAERWLKGAIKHDKRNASLRFALAETHLQSGRMADSITQYDLALADQPNLEAGIAGKASVLERRGDTKEALALVEPIIQAGGEEPYTAVVHATILQSMGQFECTIAPLQRHLGSLLQDPIVFRAASALLSKAYDKAGSHDLAFQAFDKSNRMIAPGFDQKAYAERIDNLMAVFSSQNLSILPRARKESKLPIYIASLPRSGSTLCEQIIHAHPQAHGAGEISDLVDLVMKAPDLLSSLQPFPECMGDFTQASADRFGDQYMGQLRKHSAGANRITNKHLENWLHLGMAALITPGAKCVWVRRHPLDNCVAIYMSLMRPDSTPWAFNLDDLAFVYRQHERLMEHWRSTLDIDILEVRYEDLVLDSENWTRQIINHVGLEWDDRCLRHQDAKRDVMTLSYDQVRQPIYSTSVSRWKRYEQFLEPLKTAFAGHYDIDSESIDLKP